MFNTDPDGDAPIMDAQTAAETMQLPSGFRASVFAAEPDVMNPIAMSWDTKGRLWIAENFTYAERTQRFQLDLRDRVVILDGANEDRMTKRTVFTDDVQMLTSIEVGHGGVWLMCPPKLIFIPDRDQDDVPDGPGEVVLDGFTVAKQNYHNFANGLRFGPDGWLYGRCGGSCPGKIGKPGTPDVDRAAIEGGIWRYHPTHGDFEVLTAGTTNPWGHDWNQFGELFFCNTVNGHLWHGIPGAHFTRPFTLDPNRRTYELIDFHADHWHFDTGQSWTKSRDGAANKYGGGHAHCGVVIYDGGLWPSEYKQSLFTLNFHGRRVNREHIVEEGSGYELTHEKDFLLSQDPWFRGMDLSIGPDGNVFILDWSDTGECHEHTGVHRESGRVYKIVYDGPSAGKLASSATHGGDVRDSLLQSVMSSNRWHRDQARIALAELSASGQDMSRFAMPIAEVFRSEDSSESSKIQALLTLHIIGKTNREFLIEQLNHPSSNVRSWAIRLLTERWPIDDCYGSDWKASRPQAKFTQEQLSTVDALEGLATQEASASVRLTLASTLQRLPLDRRTSLAKHIVVHADDAGDHNLPLMVWYGLMQIVDRDAMSLVDIATDCELPLTRTLIARCLAENIEQYPSAVDAIVKLIIDRDDLIFRINLLDGLSQGLRGWRTAPEPNSWQQLVNKNIEEVTPLVRDLSVVFGDGRATEELEAIAMGKRGVSPEMRMSALKTLMQSDAENLRSICESLLGDARMNVMAAQGLARFEDPDVAVALIKRYNSFRGPNKPQVIALLTSRASFAAQLLDAIERGTIKRSDLSAFGVRQIQSLGDTVLSNRVRQVWGEVRDTPEQKRNQIKSIKQMLTPRVLASADRSAGRVLFKKLCQNCHRLYGEGEKVGPDLSGANRNNLDYLLDNIVDPSAVVDKDFRMTIVLLDDGRVLNGLVTDRSNRTLTIQTSTELLTLDRETIEEEKITEKSPMPEGLLDTLSEAEIRDLVSYLNHHSQVAWPSD